MDEVKEVSSLCRVGRYHLSELKESFSNRFDCQLFDDVLQLMPLKGGGESCFHIFEYGVVVVWGVSHEEARGFIQKELKDFSENPLDFEEEDSYEYSYGSHPRINRMGIVLPNTDPLTKLAVSHALAQSVKLAIFEQTIKETIDRTQKIPHDLASTGRQSLSQRELRKRMGQLYITRSSINLHFDLLDEPDFFWDHEFLEPLYAQASKYLDIQDRIEILNQKLVVVGELFQMLNEELKHRHSSRLEWIIIILIAFEIVLTLYHDPLF